MSENGDETNWEQAAETRWGAYMTAVEERAIELAHDLASPPGRAVEVGCEGGRWTKKLADAGWQMTATDVSRESLATCQSRVPTARCIAVEPQDRTLPCEDDSASLLLCMEVAPVIHTDWFLSELDRVLAARGVFVGMNWNVASWRGLVALMRRSGSRSEPTYDHMADYYKHVYSTWRSEVEGLGFDFVHEEGFCWGPFTRRSDSALVPLFTGMEKMLGLNRLASLSPWVVFVARR